jgi:hypothetical protein
MGLSPVSGQESADCRSEAHDLEAASEAIARLHVINPLDGNFEPEMECKCKCSYSHSKGWLGQFNRILAMENISNCGPHEEMRRGWSFQLEGAVGFHTQCMDSARLAMPEAILPSRVGGIL